MTDVPDRASAPASSRPPPVSGAAWAPAFLILAGCSYSGMGALVRHTADSEGLHPFQIAFLRNLAVLLPMLCMLRPLGIPLFPRRFKVAYALRGGFELVAMLSWFVAVSLLPLGDFTAISFSATLIAALAARLVLKEPLGLDRLLAILAGLVGALVIVRPGLAGISAGAAAALLSASMIALSRVTARLLAKSEPPAALLFYFLLYTTPFAAVAAAFTWTPPSPRALVLAGLAAAAGTSGQYFQVRVYRHADVAALAPLEFLQIPIAALIGFLAFGQRPDAQSAVGAGIVVCAVLYTVRRERLRRRAASAAAATPPAGSWPR